MFQKKDIRSPSAELNRELALISPQNFDRVHQISVEKIQGSVKEHIFSPNQYECGDQPKQLAISFFSLLLIHSHL